jgi:predicted PurR-regulated permease PerM
MIGIAMPPEGFSTLGILFATGVSVLVAQSIDNMLLQPIIYSNSVKAHPLEIFVVLLMAGHLGGIMGMVLAIPAYTVLRVIAREFFSKFKIVQKLTGNMGEQ